MSDMKSWHEVMADNIVALKARIQELERQLADRDAAWKRAIRAEFLTSYDSTSGELISSVIERLEAEGGGA